MIQVIRSQLQAVVTGQEPRESIIIGILSKSFDILSVTAREASDKLETLAILSDVTVKRSTIDGKYPKPHGK